MSRIEVGGGGGGAGGGAGGGTSGTFASTVPATTATLTLPGDAGDPNGVLLVTAVTPGSAGNLLYVVPEGTGNSFTLATNNTAELRSLAGDGRTYIVHRFDSPVTASAAAAVLNGTPAVAALVTFTPGGNGSGLIAVTGDALSGGSDPPMVRIEDGIVSAPLTVKPTQLDQTPLTLEAAPGSTLGTPILNVPHADGTPNDASGYGVIHLDSDGGGGFAGGRVSWSEGGGWVVDAAAGAEPLTVKRNGLTVLLVDASGAMTWFGVDPANVGMVFYPFTDATADSAVWYDPDNVTKAFFLKANGEANAPRGVVLTSPNGTKYRQVVANDGTLSTVAV